MGTNRQSFQGCSNKKDNESHRRNMMLSKRKSCFTIAIALARHDSTATKAERLQNAKNWFLRLNTDASKVSYALKQCLAQQSLRPISPEHPQRQRQDQQEKTSITMSIGKQDGGATESHGATSRQRLHLQHRSGKTRNGSELELMVFHII